MDDARNTIPQICLDILVSADVTVFEGFVLRSLKYAKNCLEEEDIFD